VACPVISFLRRCAYTKKYGERAAEERDEFALPHLERLACWLGTARDRVGLAVADRFLRAACLAWTFSMACVHADVLAAVAVSAGCALLSFAATCACAARWVRSLMAPTSGCVVAAFVEIGGPLNTSRRATCGQAVHLKRWRSIEGV
jgi:hypothetical protein